PQDNALRPGMGVAVSLSRIAVTRRITVDATQGAVTSMSASLQAAQDDPLDALRAGGEGYKYGFVTDIEADEAPPGLNEDTVRFISAKKQEPAWLLEWRLKAYRRWLEMTEPTWPKLAIAPIDFQASTYYSAPKQAPGPKSLDEV